MTSSTPAFSLYAWTNTDENATFWTDTENPAITLNIYDSDGTDVTSNYVTGSNGVYSASSSSIVWQAEANGTIPIGVTTSSGSAGLYTYDRDSTQDILIKTYISALSKGSNIYTIKDAEARESLSTKQDTLVSGTNIKTVNNTSLLGNGNIDTYPNQLGNNGKFLSTNGSVVSWESIPTKISDLTDDTATYPIDKADTLTGLTASITELNYVDGVTSSIQTQLNGKQATLVSGTNIKTINNTSLLGEGNIDISGGGGSLPSQSGHAGEFLTTDGTSASWASIPDTFSYSNTCPAITISNGLATWNVTHNLGTSNVVVSLYQVSTGEEIIKNVAITSNNAITVTFSASENVSAGAYKIVVLAAGVSTSNTNYDGQWVRSGVTLLSSTAVPTSTDLTISLSSYLPNDNYKYEVLLHGYATAPKNTYFNYIVSSSEVGSLPFFANNNNTTGEMTLSGNMMLPVGTDRNIAVLASQWYSSSVTIQLAAEAYRRIGTNA